MPEKTTRLDPPFAHIEVTYPYDWPGFTDPVSVMNDRTGNGSILEANYLRALVAAVDNSQEQ